MLEAFVTKRRDREAALRLLKKAMKRYGNPLEVVTDRLRSYRAAMKEIGNEDAPSYRALAQQPGGKLASTVPVPRASNGQIQKRQVATENSPHYTRHSTTTSIRNAIFITAKRSKLNRTAALAQWRQLAA